MNTIWTTLAILAMAFAVCHGAGCSLPANSTIVAMRNFGLNLTDSYEVAMSSSVDIVGDLPGNRSLDQMDYLEWGKGSLVDVECRNYAMGCIKRWVFDEKKWLSEINNNTACKWYDTTAKNFSINVLVGGQVDFSKANTSVVTGYKALLSSFAGLNATRTTLNMSDYRVQVLDFNVDTMSLYSTCVEFPLLETTATVEVYVVENVDNPLLKTLYADKPRIVRIVLSDVDHGLFANNSKSGKKVTVTMTFRITYNKPPFVRGNRSSSDMFVPSEVYCPYPSNATNAMPWPSKNLHILLEESVDGDKAVIVREERINFERNYVRRSFVIPSQASLSGNTIYSSVDGWISQYGKDFKSGGDVNKVVHVIHDYNYGVEWAVTPATDQCVLRNIPVDAPDAISGANSTVLIVQDLFRILGVSSTSQNYSYFGESKFRSLPASVWGTLKTSYPKAGQNSVVKLFFLSSDSSFDTDVPSGGKSPLIGLEIYISDNTTGELRSKYRANIIEMEVETPTAFWLANDFRSCLSDATNASTFVVTFNDTSSLCDSMLKGEISDVVVQTEVITAIARASNVSHLRIGDVFINCNPSNASTKSLIDVSFHLLDRVNSSLVRGNIPNGPYIANITEVISALNITINNGSFSVNVTSSTKKSFIVTAVKNTLRLYNQTVVIQGSTTVVNEVFGHSPGAMGGLAIAMLVIGAILALFGVYLYQRRRNAQFSYMVQE